MLPSYFLKNKEDEILKKIEEKEKRSGYGEISGSILSYITPMMISVGSLIVIIVLINIPTLYLYFATNIYINGLIIFLMCFALYQAFLNNFHLYRNGRFLLEIDDFINSDYIDDKEVDKLHEEMAKRAKFFDTQNMHQAVENLKTFGHPNFTDKDAMLIKHKLGFRIRLKRADVGFMAGILVMLGLLGTFLGLLGTIDAVGQAMNAMSNISSGVDEETMTNFITSLSAPLQGMGLAFSSSLFGLSGSLLIGFFNFLCSGSQDKFIENAGRWIDERIPRYDPEKDPAKQDSKPAGNDDLKTWLTGFVYMSVKTNKQISHLVYALGKTIRGLADGQIMLQEISDNQKLSIVETQNMKQSIDHMSQSNMDHNEAVKSLLEKKNKNAEALYQKTSDALQAIDKVLSPLPSALNDAIKGLSQDLARQGHAFNQTLQHLETDLKLLVNNGQANWQEFMDFITTTKSSVLQGINESQNTLAENARTISVQLQKVEGILSQHKEVADTVSREGFERIAIELRNLSEGLSKDNASSQKIYELMAQQSLDKNDVQTLLGLVSGIHDKIRESREVADKTSADLSVILNKVEDCLRQQQQVMSNLSDNQNTKKFKGQFDDMMFELNALLSQMNVANEDKLEEILSLRELSSNNDMEEKA